VTYEKSILVDNLFYHFIKELGRGAFGVVYLYESKEGKKIVSKIFKQGINT
jgi:serine/threonine protein kinase